MNDDFIRLGGDSLTAIKLLNYFKGYNISSAEILNLKTPKAIAQNIQKNDSETNGVNDTLGGSDGSSSGTGESVQMSTLNKSVSNLLEMLDKQISLLEGFQKDGAFSVAAYFVAGSQETAVSAANLYRSMTSASRSPIRRSPIHCWSAPEAVDGIIRYLKKGRHPVFKFKKAELLPQVEAAQMISLKDIPAYFSLPEKSVPGIVVSKYAPFSRDIVVQSAFARKEERRERCGVDSYLPFEGPD